MATNAVMSPGPSRISSQGGTDRSMEFTADELDVLTTTLKEAVVAAVTESMPPEIRKLELELGNAMRLLETISTAVATPGRTDTIRSIVREDRKCSTLLSQGSSRGPLMDNLRQVSDQLFHESVNRKRSPSVSQSQNSSPPRRDFSNRSVKRREKPSSGSGGGQGRSCNEASPESDDSIASVLHRGKPSAANTRGQSKGKVDADFANLGTLSLEHRIPGRVLPHDLRDESENFFERAAKPQTVGAASQRVQDRIISKSCVGPARPETHDAMMPLAKFIISASFPYRVGLLLTILLRAALIAVLWYEYSMPMNPSHELATLIFVIAAGASSKQISKAKEYIEYATCWAGETASTVAWLTASRKKRRWLLVWWSSALLSTVPCQAGNFDRLMKFEHVDNLQKGCLWASQIMTCLIQLVSITWLVPAALLLCHIISALNVFIDVWSCELCEQRNFSEGVATWNTVQALIRRAGTSFENMFIIIQACALLGCVLVATQGVTFVLQPDWTWLGLTDIAATLPLLLLASLAGALLLQCAWITDKCSILAPLVNQIMTDAMDAGRQYLARYLTDSAAGIYVHGVKLDMMMVVNITYFLAVAATGFFGVATRFAEK